MLFILFFSCKEEVIKDPPSIFDVLKIEEVYYSGSIPTAELIDIIPINSYNYVIQVIIHWILEVLESVIYLVLPVK